jgi:hypothetical protein
VNIKKRALRMKEPTVEQPADNDTTRPKNLSASTVPSEGYVLEIDGKFKSEFETSEVAMNQLWNSRKNIRKFRLMCTTQKRMREHWSS